MGALTLPDHGPIYMDACGFIYSVERIEPYRALMEPVWQLARLGQFSIGTSELSIVETMVKPSREGDAALQRLFRDLLNSSEVRLAPTTRALWEAAAEIRAALNLRTPDALHAATSIQERCSRFVTNDSAFRRVSGLPVVVLDELQGGPCQATTPTIGKDQPATSRSDGPATSVNHVPRRAGERSLIPVHRSVQDVPAGQQPPKRCGTCCQRSEGPTTTAKTRAVTEPARSARSRCRPASRNTPRRHSPCRFRRPRCNPSGLSR